MYKHSVFLIALLLPLMLSAQGEQYIKFFTEKKIGETITLNIIADDLVTFEGIEGTYDPAENVSFTILSQEITLCGPVTDLTASNCAITSLDLSKAMSLEWLVVNDNKLRQLDLSYCSQLAQLQCANNLITQIDLSQNVALQQLFVDNNYLTELNLSACEQLSTVNCSGNALNTLDLEMCPFINQIFIYSNRFQGKGAEGFIAHLPNLAPNAQQGTIVLINTVDPGEKNSFSSKQLDQLRARGWTLKCRTESDYYQPYHEDNASAEEVPISERTSVLLEVEDAIIGHTITFTVTSLEGENVYIGKGAKGEWHNGEQVEYFVAGPLIDITGYHIQEVIANNCQLRSVDLTLAKHLESLDCSQNQITEILGGETIPRLQKLLCSQNNLSKTSTQALIETLPKNANERKTNILGIYDDSILPEKNVITIEQVKEVKSKGWQPSKWDTTSKQWIPYEGNSSTNEYHLQLTNYSLHTDTQGLWIKCYDNELLPVSLSVYRLDGLLVQQMTLTHTEQYIQLPQGSYILLIARSTHKITIE